MAFRDSSPPPLGDAERDGLLGICRAVCAWIEAAERPDRSAARAFYALYDECAVHRRGVVEACERARRGVLHRAADAGGPGRLNALIDAIVALAGVDYGDGIDPIMAAATTAEGNAAVAARAAQVEHAHRELAAALAAAGAASSDRRALEEQRLGFEQLAAREPYHAWISLYAAVRGWQGAGATSAPAADRDDVAPPAGCAACFANPDVLAGLDGEVHRRTDTLVDESHLGIHLAECRHCGQPSVQVFEEEVDYQGGDDAQRYECIAITPAERDLLRAAGSGEVLALARAIGVFRVRLWWDWPTGGRKRAGRTTPRR